MDEVQGNMKRPRYVESNVHSDSYKLLIRYLQEGQWVNAIEYLTSHTLETDIPDPSPLALACRSGAPTECVKLILDAAPERLRHVLDSRGTPLHEAVVCETIGLDVINLLLTADKNLGNKSTRATLLQDVDGFTPLHLLIRRRFQSHIQRLDEDSSMMDILEMLVSSCPEAVVIPDCGEYEEPPIVYAIKANIYAPSLGSEDVILSRVERQIYEMVRIMLKYAPEAASRVFSGFRGQYTALHSAVFHGRYTATIDLLLKTENIFPSSQKSALLTNTQSELPLHFCSMRGERPRTVALLAKAAPEAVIKRDATGLTPYHWLWIRFVSTLLALDDDRRSIEESCIYLKKVTLINDETNRYNAFAVIEQGDFEADLPLLKRMDPPVDFLRMRHIPVEVSENSNCFYWAEKSLEILQQIREKYKTQINGGRMWTRQEVIISLFWTKSVSLLDAYSKSQQISMPSGNRIFIHTVFASSCCPPPAALLAAKLFPYELTMLDKRGRLPIHYAACRNWHEWDWPREDGLHEGASSRLLTEESLNSLRVALDLSPNEAMHVADNDNRLVIHHAINTFVQSHLKVFRHTPMCATFREMLSILGKLVHANPESLHIRDGKTMLFPFLEATAIASECANYTNTGINETLQLSITFFLLRQKPTVLLNFFINLC